MIPGIKIAGRQTELKFQDHIIDSYHNHGGHAAKWASEWQKGKPDLICSLPFWGVHLLEVKHLPEFGSAKSMVRNALDTKQRSETKAYLEGGGLVRVAVVAFDTHANKSKLGLFHTQIDSWFVGDTQWVEYVPGKGYNMPELLKRNVMI